MANNMDDFRGMSPNDMKSQNQKTRVDGDSDEGQSSTQAKTGQQDSNNNQQSSGNNQQTQDQQTADNKQQKSQNKQANSQQDSDEDLTKEIKLLTNTFGYSEDEINEKAINLAKSYLKSQSSFTKKSQSLSEIQDEKQKYEQTLKGFKGFLDQNPDIAKMIQKRAKKENSQQQEPTQGKPNSSNERKLNNITEHQLIQAGYLEDGELEGLDDLQRAERLIDAKSEYLTDNKLQQFEQKLQQKEKSLEQERKEKLIKEENNKRIEDGFERLVVDYGVDFNEVPDSVMDAIRKRAIRIKDPQDPSGQLIDEDAYYDAGLKELASAGYIDVNNRFGINNQQEQQNGLEDTGTNMRSKNQQNQTSEKSLGELMNESNAKRWNQVIDKGSRLEQMKQKVNTN